MKRLLTILSAMVCLSSLFATAQNDKDIPDIFRYYIKDIDYIVEVFDEVKTQDELAQSLKEWAEILCPYTKQFVNIGVPRREWLDECNKKAIKAEYYAYFRSEGYDLSNTDIKAKVDQEYKGFEDKVLAETSDSKNLAQYAKSQIEFIVPGFRCNTGSGHYGDRTYRDIRKRRTVTTDTSESHYSTSTTNHCAYPDNKDKVGKTANRTGKDTTLGKQTGKNGTPGGGGATPVRSDTIEAHYSSTISDATDCGVYGTTDNTSKPKGLVTKENTSDVVAYLKFYDDLYEKSKQCTTHTEYKTMVKNAESEMLRFMQSNQAINNVDRKALVELSLYYAPRLAMEEFRITGNKIDFALLEYIIGGRPGLKTALGNRPDVTDAEIKLLEKYLNVIPSLRQKLYEIANNSRTLGEFLRGIPVAVGQIAESLSKARTILK